MGERKGQNLYYPPDYDPKKGGINKAQGTHALRERARKLHLGILIIRFEMPYNIWCEGCGNHIGMGVRYNAEKTKIGMYYTTPVYQFRMKCHLCDNHFEIKTDPGNLDYVIVSGARRQENRWDPTQNEQVVPEDKNTQKRLFDDAMFKLEHQKEDLDTSQKQNPKLVKLYQRNETVWSDDFESNKALRKVYRDNRRKIVEDEKSATAIAAKNGLGIEILPEHPEDIQVAAILARKAAEKKEITEKLTKPTLVTSRSKRLLQDSLASKMGGLVKRNKASPGSSKNITTSESKMNEEMGANSSTGDSFNILDSGIGITDPCFSKMITELSEKQNISEKNVIFTENKSTENENKVVINNSLVKSSIEADSENNEMPTEPCISAISTKSVGNTFLPVSLNLEFGKSVVATNALSLLGSYDSCSSDGSE